MHDKGLILLTVDQQIAVVTLNNPPANVLSRAVIEQLSQTFHDLERMDLAAIILTGQDDRFFSAGADIKELAENTVEQNRSYFSRVYETFSLIADCRFPVIAAVNGYAVGAGLELALCADIRVMDENAQLAATGVNLNLVFCTQRLVRLVGPGRAKDMLLYARRVNAAEASQFGLVEHIAPPGMAGGKARDIALLISQKGQEAVQGVKQVLNQGINLPLNQALDLEAEHIYRLFASSEFDRRARLFLNK